MSMTTLTCVCVSNALGLALLISTAVSNRNSLQKRDMLHMYSLLAVAAFACIADPLVYWADGKSGAFYTVIIYLGNSWLYLANIITGYVWVVSIADHLNLQIRKSHRVLMQVFNSFAVILLVVNLFYPLVFSVTDNVYHRESFYWVYVAGAGLYMLNGLRIYFKVIRRSGHLRLYPIWFFVAPVVCGVVVQSLFYGVSVIWPSVGIAVAGVMSSMKDEVIFRDRLTGLYNRAYFEFIGNNFHKKGRYYSGVMADINDFKSINDRFGHSVGDDALCDMAEVFRKSVGTDGVVMRYAGDEFVLLLNTVDDREIQNFRSRLQGNLNRLNESGRRPYQLSVAMGISAVNPENQTINDFMNTIDRLMYEDKQKYYAAKGENNV